MNEKERQEFAGMLRQRRSDLMLVIADQRRLLATQLNPSEESHVDFEHPADMVAERGDPDYEKTLSLTRREAAELALVDQALTRLTAGTYGRCDDCHREIPGERLRAIPYTRYCSACEAAREPRPARMSSVGMKPAEPASDSLT